MRPCADPVFPSVAQLRDRYGGSWAHYCPFVPEVGELYPQGNGSKVGACGKADGLPHPPLLVRDLGGAPMVGRLVDCVCWCPGVLPGSHALVTLVAPVRSVAWSVARDGLATRNTRSVMRAPESGRRGVSHPDGFFYLSQVEAGDRSPLRRCPLSVVCCRVRQKVWHDWTQEERRSEPHHTRFRSHET